MYDIVMFDLDGTLTDSEPGILNGFRYVCRYFDVTVEDMRPFLGPPLARSMRTIFGDDPAKIEMGVQKYREYYFSKGMYENRVYDGVEDTLRQLRLRGKRLLVATAKVTELAERILAHFGLLSYFEFVGGSKMDNTRAEKAEIIAYALQNAGVTNPKGVLMVGDRRYDIEGAKRVGADCAGVLYGYGTRAELTQAGADYIVQDMAEILAIVN